jgi:hypothetical protein
MWDDKDGSRRIAGCRKSLLLRLFFPKTSSWREAKRTQTNKGVFRVGSHEQAVQFY